MDIDFSLTSTSSTPGESGSSGINSREANRVTTPMVLRGANNSGSSDSGGVRKGAMKTKRSASPLQRLMVGDCPRLRASGVNAAISSRPFVSEAVPSTSTLNLAPVTDLMSRVIKFDRSLRVSMEKSLQLWNAPCNVIRQ